MKATVVTVTLNPAIDKTVTVPTLQVGGLNRVREGRIDPGGKGINVAKVVSGFGLPVVATGFIAGAQGGRLLQQLASKGIDVSFVEVAGETRTNLKIVAADTQVTTEVNESGFPVTSEDVATFRDRLSELLDSASILVLGGSVPPGVDTDIYQDLTRLANAKGVKTILDADASALQKGIEARPFAIKPNVVELEELVGRELKSHADILAAGRELLAKGISLVAISMGGEGSIWLNESEGYYVEPFPITPQSTVGAGDSMVATLAYCLLQGKSLQETAEWATTAGTVTASKCGTQVCTLQEVIDNVSRVTSTKL